MSLARIMLRMSAIEALRGKTQVGDNVLDSQIGALDVGADGNARTDQEAPFISVYVEGALNEKPARQAALHAPGETDILFEFGITAAMTETDPETGESTVFMGIPATDGAFELFLDIVDREIVNALTDPTNEWAQIFRDLSTETVKIVRRRTSDAGSGTRIAAHQLVLTQKLMQEPIKGVTRDANCPYARFLTKLAAKPDATSQRTAAVLRALIEPGGAPSMDIWQRTFGASKATAEMLGHGEGTWPESVTTTIISPFAPEPVNE